MPAMMAWVLIGCASHDGMRRRWAKMGWGVDRMGQP